MVNEVLNKQNQITFLQWKILLELFLESSSLNQILISIPSNSEKLKFLFHNMILLIILRFEALLKK